MTQAGESFSKIVILSEIEGVTISGIGGYAFYNCSSLTSVTIPDSVTSIGEFAFESCSSLTSLIIGSAVSTIGYGVFNTCNNFTMVFYRGTANNLDRIKKIIENIKVDNTGLMRATWYYYSENNPYEINANDTYNYWHYDVYGVTPVIWKKEN